MAKDDLGSKTHRKKVEQPAKTTDERLNSQLKQTGPDLDQEQERLGNAQVSAHFQQSSDPLNPTDTQHGVRHKKSADTTGPEHGGEDEPFSDDGTLSILSLLPTPPAPPSKENVASQFLELLPEAVLPPANPLFLQFTTQSTEAQPPSQFKLTFSPTPRLVSSRLNSWLPTLALYRNKSPLWDACAAILQPLAPVFHPNDSTLILGRSRALALSELVFLGESDEQPRQEAPLINRLLELRCRADQIHAIRVISHHLGKKIPLSTELFLQQAPPETGTELVPPTATPSAPPCETIQETLVALLKWPNPLAFVPTLNDPPPAEHTHEDDPLHLDQLIISLTTGQETHESMLSQAAIQGAERMASACVQLRISSAGLAALVAQTLADTTGSLPNSALLKPLQRLDTSVSTTLNTLVEIARAAKKQRVPAKGLQNGLRRCAKRLIRAKKQLLTNLSALVAINTEPPISPETHLENPILEAIQTQGPQAALTSLSQANETPAHAIIQRSYVLTTDEPDENTRVSHPILDIITGATQLNAKKYTQASLLATSRMTDALSKKRAFNYADAALLYLECMVGDHQPSDKIWQKQLQFGRTLHTLQQPGALSLIARWSGPIQAENHK